MSGMLALKSACEVGNVHWAFGSIFFVSGGRDLGAVGLQWLMSSPKESYVVG